MIAAVSADLSAPSRPASTTSTGWHFAPVPDLNRETKRRITKASAWPTFIGICVALRHEGRKGRTPEIRQAAKDQQRVGVGLRHLARDMGLNVSTVRRHVRRLAEIGVIVVHRPNVTFRADLATGRIVTKAKGRCENTRVYLTILPEHLRPTKAGTGAKRAHPPADPMAQSAPTVRESLNQRTPDGLATSVGQPQAGQAGRLPAAGPGGHSAAKAGQERPPILPVDAGRDEPVLPVGRVIREAKASPPPRRTNPYQEASRGPQPFIGRDAEAWERTRRLEAEKAARAAPPDGTGLRGGSFLDEYRKATGKA